MSSEKDNLSARSRELLRLAPTRLHEACMKMFLSKHWDILNKVSSIPWYVPEWLGGYGLPRGSWGGPTELDLRLVQKILFNWSHSRPISPSKKEMTWTTWIVAENSLPEPFFCDTKNIYTEQYTSMVNRKCISLLFDSNIKLDTLFKETEGRGQWMLFHNQRIYEKALKGKLPAPLPLEKLDFVARYPNYVYGNV
jgi:hypothetical protein